MKQFVIGTVLTDDQVGVSIVTPDHVDVMYFSQFWERTTERPLGNHVVLVCHSATRQLDLHVTARREKASVPAAPGWISSPCS